MKVLLTKQIQQFCPQYNYSKTYTLGCEFLKNHPEVRTEIVGNKVKKIYLISQKDVDTLKGFLQAKGAMTGTALAILPDSTGQKEQLASLLRNVKQLRAAGYEINISVREPAREF